MKKIIWIDVGTHFAQEYESAFGSNFKLFGDYSEDSLLE